MGLGVTLFFVGMWRVDGVMAAMGLSVFGLITISRFLGKFNLAELSLTYRGPRRVEAGKGFQWKVSLANGRRMLDGFWVDFGVNLMREAPLPGRVLWLEAGETVSVAGRVSLKKRGLRESQVGWVKSGFPLGVFSFSRALEVPAEVGIYPAMKIPRELYLSGFLLEGSPLGGSRASGGIGEWRGVREWRGGDSVRRIAWSASMRSEAAGGGMLVREDEPPGSQAEGCLLVFHSYGSDGHLIRPDRFEKALALLSGSLAALNGWGIDARWVADFTDWEETEVKTRVQLARTREKLISAERSSGTEAHDLIQAFSTARDSECVIIISDMAKETWEAFVPKFHLVPVILDITRYDGAAKLGKRGRR